eukprot:jgi/Botrbrau1/7811/Bobra.0159s0239.1
MASCGVFRVYRACFLYCRESCAIYQGEDIDRPVNAIWPWRKPFQGVIASIKSEVHPQAVHACTACSWQLHADWNTAERLPVMMVI